MKVKIRPERCKSCGLCAVNCPKKAISFSHKANAAGHYPTVIDDTACIACGICYTVCPDGVYHILGEEV